jgi:hypothetical protein
MIYIKLTRQSLILSVIVFFIMIIALTSSGILCRQCTGNSQLFQQFTPCNISNNNQEFLKPTVYTPHLISNWNKERLDELWPVQGISKHDTNGGINPRQGGRYAEMAFFDSKIEVKVVCETGFFRGGSTLFWLMLFKNSIVHSFDLSFPDSAIKWFDQKYPGRLVIHKGDSKQLISTLPKDTCDWVSVDGDHGPGGAYNDIKEFAKVSKPGALLVSDDTFDCTLSPNSCTECNDNCPCKGHRPFCNECSHGFQQTVIENVVNWSGCDRYGVSQDGKYPIGSCYGYIN